MSFNRMGFSWQERWNFSLTGLFSALPQVPKRLERQKNRRTVLDQKSSGRRNQNRKLAPNSFLRFRNEIFEQNLWQEDGEKREVDVWDRCVSDAGRRKWCLHFHERSGEEREFQLENSCWRHRYDAIVGLFWLWCLLFIYLFIFRTKNVNFLFWTARLI